LTEFIRHTAHCAPLDHSAVTLLSRVTFCYRTIALLMKASISSSDNPAPRPFHDEAIRRLVELGLKVKGK
jgi:hypothetical protein